MWSTKSLFPKYTVICKETQSYELSFYQGIEYILLLVNFLVIFMTLTVNWSESQESECAIQYTTSMYSTFF